MADITTSLALVHPAANSQGIILSDQIWIIFTGEMDEFSIREGNFFVTGPDTDTFFGPDIAISLPNVSNSSSNDQFKSPGFEGIVSGEFTFKKINLTDLNEYTGSLDTTGSGNLWRTKVIFTPSIALAPETTYNIYVSGDEDIPDSLVTGIRTRTIFDYIALGGNTGTGTLLLDGTYTAATQDTIHIKVSTAGTSGVAWFVWWRASAPLSISNPILSDRYNFQDLDNGIKVKFGDGQFDLDDEFTFIVKPPTLFSGNTVWTFDSGTGSITAIPTTTATSVIGDMPQAINSSNILSVVNISPKDRASNLPVTTRKIVINFNNSIDPSTVTADTIKIVAKPVNGDETLLQTREIFSDITVSGSKIIIDI